MMADWVMRQPRTSTIIQESMKSEIQITSKHEPFLMRQVIIKPRSAEEAFNIIKKAVTNEKTVQMIVTPRVDKGRKAYFYVGIKR